MGSTGVQQPLEPAARSGTRSSHSTALPPGSSPRRARGCPPTPVQHGHTHTPLPQALSRGTDTLK